MTIDRPALAELVAQPGFFVDVAAVIQRIPAAGDQGDVLALLKDAADRMGADAAAFGSFIRDDPSHESFRFLLACDPVWCLEYGRLAWYAHDPWLNYAARSSEPVCASEIPVETSEGREIVDLATRFGVRSAAIVPAPASGQISRIGVLLLCSKRAGYFEADGFVALKVLARSLAMELHEWWVAQIKKELLEATGLTEEDLFLLRQERVGLKSKNIAAALGVSPVSIDSRFARINAKLGVGTRSAAANVVAEYGLI